MRNGKEPRFIVRRGHELHADRETAGRKSARK
jgi:hypothetical protein